MNDIVEFGRIIVVVAGGLSIAILVRVIAARIGLPTAALAARRGGRRLRPLRPARLAALLRGRPTDRHARADRDPVRRRHEHGARAVPLRRRSDHGPRRARHVRDRPTRRRRRALRARLRLDRRPPDRRGPRPDRSRSHVLRPRREGGRRPLRHDSGGRVGVQRPGRDRADDRDDRARHGAGRRRRPTSRGSSCARWASDSRRAPSAGFVLLQLHPTQCRCPTPRSTRSRWCSLAGVVYGIAAVLARLGLSRRLRRRDRDRRRGVPEPDRGAAFPRRRSPTSASSRSSSRSG